ncbi:LOW QUALITY PROTEIN: uncharacterized protein [Macrobrachium rosenbergii]|uniref:LOW QUALITY PROTEIN: uncharacterized protein n=1 Tax=Macrobrachium rosenbergii TaxID=79674 RepID=UPI0034D74E23
MRLLWTHPDWCRIPLSLWLCSLLASCLDETTTSAKTKELVEEGPAETLFLDLEQIFIPTLPTVRDQEEKGAVRHNLPVGVSEEAPGILTIGTESPWEKNKSSGDASTMEAPYGSWKSPVSSDIVTRETYTIVEPPKVDPITGNVFWSERLASEGGRHAVFHYNPETKVVVRWTPENFNVHTMVHEYGGGSFTVYNNTLFFSNGYDWGLYRQDGPDGIPKLLTNTPYRRFADGCYCPRLDSLFLVVEDHDLLQKGKAKEPENGIVIVNARTGEQNVIAAHADFFSSPRVSQDGNYLVWIQWNHPNMPWTETRMFVAEIVDDKGRLTIVKYFQHGSMMTPSFNQNNEIFYVHDSTGWWNLYKVNRRGFEINLTNQSQEVGWPMWQFGRQAYDVNPRIGHDEVVAICGNDLTVIDSIKLEKRILHTGYSTYSLGVVYALDGKKVFVVAGDEMRPFRLIEVDLDTGGVRSLRQLLRDADAPSSPSLSSPPLHQLVDPGYISIAKQIQFPTTQGDFAYGYLYLPKNKDYTAPEGTKPPLLVKAHGGPTSAASRVINLTYQFFTSRGFAILDVDYRGSTGYGTLYRNKLHEMWGVYDVADVLAGSEYLVKEGLVDRNMLCIDGHSAGGYTTLSALTVTGSPFKAGASYYGISDLELLATDTHKFESQYMEGLVGNMEEYKARYAARSPLKNSEKLDVPMIFFQGTEDKIVPPSQARGMYELVKGKGLPTAFLLFEGEGHEFVRSESQKKSLEGEIFFFAKIFNITLGDITSDIFIDNLDKWRNEPKYTIQKITLQ